ncbi:MAG: hypothetical protein U9R54_00895 [Bacteroidota bacterium]|nr:hypothetical protein [Bacteroidota bacterium]
MKKMDFVQILVLFFIFLLAVPVSSFAQEKEDGFTFGGAVRYNIMSTNYESDPTALSTSATWDTWRLNVDGSMKGVDLSFEYRFYPTFGSHFIHHGWLGYEFSDNVYMKLGVHQVPFGITKYASHSWWFQGPYYVGLEDDYDMGIKFDLGFIENLDLAIAYYRQAEPEGPIFSGDVTFGGAGAGRYSYDMVPTTNINVRELNQFNLRSAYHINDDIEIGISAQVGQNYNAVLEESETSTAFAGHVLANFAGFNFKGEYVKYNYNAKDNVGTDLDIVNMGAYGFGYDVAKEASMYVAGIAYGIDVEWGPISNIQPYVDFTLTDKANENFENTYQLVPGALVTAGSIYMYVDFAMGKNQPWLHDTADFGVGLGQGRVYSDDAAAQGTDYYTNDASMVGKPVPIEDLEWNTRFNINLGYYF